MNDVEQENNSMSATERKTDEQELNEVEKNQTKKNESINNKKKSNRKPRWDRIIAAAGVGIATLIGGATAAVSGISSLVKQVQNGKNYDDVYITELDNERDITIKSKSGKDIVLPGNDDVKNEVILNTKKSVTDGTYDAVVESDGRLIECTVNEEDIASKNTDEVSDFKNKNSDINIGKISCADGAIVYKGDDETSSKIGSLSTGDYVVVGAKSTDNDGNNWRKVLFYDDENATTGYVKDDYILDNEKYYNLDEFKALADISLVQNLGYTDPVETLEKGSILREAPGNTKYQVGEDVYMFTIYRNEEGVTCFAWAKIKDKDKDLLEKYNGDNEQTQSNLKSFKVNTNFDGGMDLTCRENPGIYEKAVSTFENGAIVYAYAEDIANQSVVDGYTWLKVESGEGDKKVSGYVAAEYLQDYNYGEYGSTPFDITIGNEKTQSVVFGVDLQPAGCGLSEDEFKAFLKGEYYGGEEKNKDVEINGVSLKSRRPDYVYLKIGATGYQDQFVIAQNDNPEYNAAVKAKKYIEICEEVGIPYGLYYYSQAVTNDEANAEIAYWKTLYDGLTSTKYNVLPNAVDVEIVNGDDGYSRNYNFVNACGSKEQYTDVVNSMIINLRKEIGKDFCLYTDHGSLENILDLNNLDESITSRLWLVDIASNPEGHSDALRTLGVADSSINRQVYVSDSGWDYDVMNVDFYDECTRGIINNNRDNDQENLEIEDNEELMEINTDNTISTMEIDR